MAPYKNLVAVLWSECAFVNWPITVTVDEE